MTVEGQKHVERSISEFLLIKARVRYWRHFFVSHCISKIRLHM